MFIDSKNPVFLNYRVYGIDNLDPYNTMECADGHSFTTAILIVDVTDDTFYKSTIILLSSNGTAPDLCGNFTPPPCSVPKCRE
jgi:hypothetical protein